MLPRRKFLQLSSVATLSSSFGLTGCGYLRIDPWHPLLRSDRLVSIEQINSLVARARVEKLPKSDGQGESAVRVLYLQGDPYEIGFQQGALLRTEVRDGLMSMYDNVLDVYLSDEFFDESYERLRPFIPQAYIDEMHGLAHGSRIPLRVIHALHALPEMSEWGGKDRIKGLVKQMMAGDLATSCSNIGALQASTADGKLLAVRILDWGLYKVSRLHEYPQITVVRPSPLKTSQGGGIPYANVGWTGFLGAVSGMNEAGITLGEMGYGSPPGEHLRGMPMIFLLREVLSKAESLNDVRKILKEAQGNNSYVFLMSDGKRNEAAMFIKDKDRLVEFKPGQDVNEKDQTLPGIKNIVYGGHYLDRMTAHMQSNNGALTPELLMNDIIPQLAMKGNFHNVVYRPEDLHLWVSNARGEDKPAFKEPYVFFDLKAALKRM
jgi:isopenicillin-N N-acyltransferase like protein